MAKSRFRKEDKEPMFFSSFNYKLIGLAIGLIAIGFAAMLIENEIHGFISLYVSPIVILTGFTIVVFAILKHDRPDQEEPSKLN